MIVKAKYHKVLDHVSTATVQSNYCKTERGRLFSRWDLGRKFNHERGIKCTRFGTSEHVRNEKEFLP